MDGIISSQCKKCGSSTPGRHVSHAAIQRTISEWKCHRCMAPARDCRITIEPVYPTEAFVPEAALVRQQEDDSERETFIPETPLVQQQEEEVDDLEQEILAPLFRTEAHQLMRAINDSLVSYQEYDETVAKKGLDLGQVFALPCGRFEDSSVYCGVCQEPAVGDFITRLPNCSHRFHKTCINPWLLENNSCPNCRKQVV